MKKIIQISFIGLILSSSTLFAQNIQSIKQKAELLPNHELQKSQTAAVCLNDSSYTYYWDTVTNSFSILDARILYTYDIHGYMTNLLSQGWYGTEWGNGYQRSFTYDSNHNLIIELIPSWDGSNWINSTKRVYTYDVNDNLITFENQYWAGTTWITQSQTTYVYDGNNNETSQSSQTWDGTLWTNTSKSISTYDINNNLVSVLNQYWSVSAWEDVGLVSFSYDVNNNRLSQLNQLWYVSSFVNDRQYLYTYDANNNELSMTAQIWENNAWLNDWRLLSTYDFNNYLLNNVVQYWVINEWKNSSITYYYCALSSGIADNESELAKISIYPNPAREKITIQSEFEINNYQVYDLNNRLLQQQTIKNEKEFEVAVSALAAGVYYIRLETERGSVVKKIIKEN